MMPAIGSRVRAKYLASSGKVAMMNTLWCGCQPPVCVLFARFTGVISEAADTSADRVRFTTTTSEERGTEWHKTASITCSRAFRAVSHGLGSRYSVREVTRTSTYNAGMRSHAIRARRSFATVCVFGAVLYGGGGMPSQHETPISPRSRTVADRMAEKPVGDRVNAPGAAWPQGLRPFGLVAGWVIPRSDV
eukprot:4200826-Prymnesium_polylepis.1